MTSVSVVIPTYNRSDLVSRAIESALTQTHAASEILVVDDGSSDFTRAVVERFAPQVTYLWQENAGVSRARNNGVTAASSTWIAFLDSDDVWVPDYLERIVAAIEATQGAALAYFADLEEEGQAVSVWGRAGMEIDEEYELRTDPSDWFMLPLQPMTTQSTVVDREAYLRLGGQRSDILCRQDTHLFFMLGFSGPACAVAGIGARLTAAAEEARLTGVHSPRTRSYCADTILTYADVLARCTSLRREHRIELRRRLACAYWQRARLEARDGAILGSIAAAGRSLATAPSVIPGRIRNHLLPRMAAA